MSRWRFFGLRWWGKRSSISPPGPTTTLIGEHPKPIAEHAEATHQRTLLQKDHTPADKQRASRRRTTTPPTNHPICPWNRTRPQGNTQTHPKRRQHEPDPPPPAYRPVGRHTTVQA